MGKSYKDQFKNEDGVWRTIGGRKVFIRNGQSLSDAMKESGKFKKVSDVKREEYHYKKDKLDRERQAEISRKYVGKEKRTEEGQEAFNKYAELHDRTYVRENPQEADTTYDLVGQHINKEQQLGDIKNKYATNNGSGYDDNTSAYADKALDYWQKQRQDTLSRGGDTSWEDDSIKRWEREKQNRLYGEKDLKLSSKQAEEGNRLNSKAENGVREDIKTFLSGKEDYDGSREDFVRDLSNEWGVDRNKVEEILHEENSKHPRLFKTDRQTNYELTSNNFKNNWQDEIKTKEQLIEKEKEVKQQYENYKKQVEAHRKDWNETTIRKNEESYQKTLQNIEDWKKEFDREKAQSFDREKAQSFVNAFETALKEEQTGFVQHTDMYGGTYEYTNADLKRMEEAGVKPMEHSYTGGGWEGVNSKKNLSTKDQAKAITDEMKKQFPDVKISRKSDVYSMGSSIDFNVMSSGKDLYISDKDIDKFGNEQLFNTDITRGYGFSNWAEKNVPTYRTDKSYSFDDVKRYAKETLKDTRNHQQQSVRGNEWYLSDYGKKVISELNKQANSYTYSDSDGQVDYFDHGTYMHINIGKWDKPYEVSSKSSSTSSLKNAYEEYKKEHKGTGLSFEDFKKWYK